MKIFLWILSRIYYIIVILRTCLYGAGIIKTKKLGIPVICVGNITAGGTGKTPAVIFIANLLKNLGKNLCIISHGYKSKVRSKKSEVVSDGKRIVVGTDISGDEPYMIAKNLKGIPVVVGSDRYNSGMLASDKFSSDCILMDDGFQHFALYRDLDIVVIDATEPFGNEKILPLGRLREPLKNLSRAGLFLLTKTNQENSLKLEEIEKRLNTLNPHSPVVKTIHKPVYFENIKTKEKFPLNFFEGKNVIAVASIGNPESFLMTLNEVGCVVALKRIYPDHYIYKKRDIEEIVEILQKEKLPVITTEKDAVRLTDEFDGYFLKIEIEIVEGKEKLEEKIKRCFH